VANVTDDRQTTDGRTATYSECSPSHKIVSLRIPMLVLTQFLNLLLTSRWWSS